MGLVLDSSAAVAPERQGKNARQLLESVAAQCGEEEIALSVVSLLELMHGVTRANTAERHDKRQRFLHELMRAVPTYPVNVSMALRAGQIDGQTQTEGVRIALADLLIGVTALELGYAIGTANVRDFRRIPGLKVVQL